MPRSGSTLLCNILNQNQQFHASSTSCIAQTTRVVSHHWSTSPEIKSDLLYDKDGTEARMVAATRALVEAWYDGKGDVIFDKGRAWNHSALTLNQIFPTANMFVCVRDLRDIFASIEKQHAKNPMLDPAGSPVELTTYNRADNLFAPSGLVGQQIIGVEDLLRRKLPFVHLIQFETLVQNPKLVMDSIYAVLGEESFQHDFENVKNTATDADGLYLNKYPHEGSGAVEPPPGSWADHVSPDIANLIMQKFAGYNQAFGYQG